METKRWDRNICPFPLDIFLQLLFAFWFVCADTCTTSPSKAFLFLEMSVADCVGEMQIANFYAVHCIYILICLVCHFHRQILVMSKAVTRTYWQCLQQAYNVRQMDRFLPIAETSLAKINHIFLLNYLCFTKQYLFYWIFHDEQNVSLMFYYFPVLFPCWFCKAVAQIINYPSIQWPFMLPQGLSPFYICSLLSSAWPALNWTPREQNAT